MEKSALSYVFTSGCMITSKAKINSLKKNLHPSGSFGFGGAPFNFILAFEANSIASLNCTFSNKSPMWLGGPNLILYSSYPIPKR